MPGYWTEDNLPERPGTYFRFEPEQEVAIPPSVGLVVALGFVHDWGPYQTVQEVGSLAEFKKLYGRNEDTEGFRAVKMAFQGEGVAGAGGAGTILCYRMGGSAAAKATKVLQNTTPAPAVTITAKYEGARANNFRITTQDKAGETTKTEFILLEGTQEIERYEFLDADIPSLVAQINAQSKNITAVATVTTVPLAIVSATPLTGGADGGTLLAADYTEAMSALDVQRFSVLAFANLTDTAIQASLKTWAINLNTNGKRFMTVVGGLAGENATTAIARSATFNDENFVNLGIGTYEDESLMNPASGAPYQLSTAQLAPRLAGILARRGEAMSLTFARLAGLRIVSGPTEGDVLATFNGGTTVIARDSNVAAPVRVEKGLTTFTLTTDPGKPQSIYRNPKYVRTMSGIQTELQEWADSNVIGRLPVNNKTRDYVLGQAKASLGAREQAGVVQPDWVVFVDPDSTDDDEFVSIVIGIKFGRSTEMVLFTCTVG